MWKEREKKEHFKMFQTERLRLIHCSTFLLRWMTIFMGGYPFTHILDILTVKQMRSQARFPPLSRSPVSLSLGLGEGHELISRTAAGNRAQWDPINVVTILKYHDSYDSFLVRFFFEMLFDLLFGFSWLMKWSY